MSLKYLFTLLASVVIIFVMATAVIPWIRSFHKYELSSGESSLNLSGASYKINWMKIDFNHLDAENVYFTAIDHWSFRGPRQESLSRSLASPYANAYKSRNEWKVKPFEVGRPSIEVPVVLHNLATGDSITVFLENFTDVGIDAFENGSDTTLLVLTQCDFKHSSHCVLAYVYAWPKNK